MKKDLQYYIGYIATIFVAIILTPFYSVMITIIRTFIFLWELLYDTITFMPKALYEFERAYKKRYWEKELERFKDD
jgi:hypothetical protein